MLEAGIVIGLLTVLALLFWPRRSPYVRKVSSPRNGQPRWRDQEPY